MSAWHSVTTRDHGTSWTDICAKKHMFAALRDIAWWIKINRNEYKMLMVSIVIRYWSRCLHIRWAMLAYRLKLLDAGFDIYISPWLIQEKVWVESPWWSVPCSELFETLIKLNKKNWLCEIMEYTRFKVTITDMVANGKYDKFDCSTKLKHSGQLFRGSQSFT